MLQLQEFTHFKPFVVLVGFLCLLRFIRKVHVLGVKRSSECRTALIPRQKHQLTIKQAISVYQVLISKTATIIWCLSGGGSGDTQEEEIGSSSGDTQDGGSHTWKRDIDTREADNDKVVSESVTGCQITCKQPVVARSM